MIFSEHFKAIPFSFSCSFFPYRCSFFYTVICIHVRLITTLFSFKTFAFFIVSSPKFHILNGKYNKKSECKVEKYIMIIEENYRRTTTQKGKKSQETMYRVTDKNKHRKDMNKRCDFYDIRAYRQLFLLIFKYFC